MRGKRTSLEIPQTHILLIASLLSHGNAPIPAAALAALASCLEAAPPTNEQLLSLLRQIVLPLFAGEVCLPSFLAVAVRSLSGY